MTQLQEGEVVVSARGNRYRVIRYLGEGLTARVYEAEELGSGKGVALKVLNEGVPEEVAISFRDEADILSLLANAEARSGDGLALVPKVEERAYDKDAPSKIEGTDSALRMLVMELVSGKSILDLLDTQDGLDESTVLTIADQVLRVLSLLHIELLRSYTDFQLRNIWWRPDDGQIKLMDWNHVSLPVREGELPPGVADDLVRFGAYFYQMLTGKGAQQSGESAQALASRAGEHWHEISVGTRYIILRALHPNPEHRFSSAAEFRRSVQEQQRLWLQDEDELYDQVLDVMRKLRADERPSPEQLQEAETLVDMLARRRPDDKLANKQLEEVKQLTDEVSATWGAGRQYYRAGLYSRANELWSIEADTWRRPDLWRWVILARIGADLVPSYEEHQLDLESALMLMEAESWRAAAQRLPNFDNASLVSLKREINAHLMVQQAEEAETSQEWLDAARNYAAAAQELSGIKESGYLKALYEAYGWDQLEKREEVCRTRAQKLDKDIQLEAKLRASKGNFETELKEFTGQLRADPRSTVLLNYAEQEATNELRPANERMALATIALQYGVMSSDERLVLRTQQQAARLQQAYENANWDEFRTAASNLPAEALPNSMSTDLESRYRKAVNAEALGAAQALAYALEPIDSAGAQRRAQELAKLAGTDDRVVVLRSRWESHMGNVNAALETSPPEFKKANDSWQYARSEYDKLLALQELGLVSAQETASMKRSMEERGAAINQGLQELEAREAAASRKREAELAAAYAAAEAARKENDSSAEESVPSEKRPLWRRLLPLLLLAVAGAALAVGGFAGGWLSKPPPEIAVIDVTATIDPAALPPVSTTLSLPTQTLPPPTPIATFPPTVVSPTDTPEPTPVPTVALGLLSSSPPVPGSPNAYFDVPDLTLTAPDGWLFDLTSEDLKLVLVENPSQQLFMKLVDDEGNIIFEDEPLGRELVTGILAATTEDLVEGKTILVPPMAQSVQIDWSRQTDSAPWTPGELTLQFGIKSNEDGVQDNLVGPPLMFAIRPPITVTVAAGDEHSTYKNSPQWSEDEDVTDRPDAGNPLQVDAIGKIAVPDDEYGEYFLLIRLPGTREEYWLPDNDTVEMQDSNAWQTILAALPDVTWPPSD